MWGYEYKFFLQQKNEKNNKQIWENMKTLKLNEISQAIKEAQKRLDEICLLNEGVVKFGFLHSGELCKKQESLKEEIEAIRLKIAKQLRRAKDAKLKDTIAECRDQLDKLLSISETLCHNYAFAGYNESYYVYDSLKVADDWLG